MKMEASPMPNGQAQQQRCAGSYFQLPLNYPRYTKADYETMPEWKLDLLFLEYGLPVTGDLAQKRSFAVGTFLWPNYWSWGFSHDKAYSGGFTVLFPLVLNKLRGGILMSCVCTCIKIFLYYYLCYLLSSEREESLRYSKAWPGVFLIQ